MIEKGGMEKRTKDDLCNGKNRYIAETNWKIGKPIRDIFEQPRLYEILKNCVIMNSVYFYSNQVKDLKNFAHGKDMINLCRNLTNEFVYEILKPKTILFIGDDAAKWMSVKYNNIENTVLRSETEKRISLIKRVTINSIPHYKIHHTSRNWSFNNGRNLELKKKFFEENIF